MREGRLGTWCSCATLAVLVSCGGEASNPSADAPSSQGNDVQVDAPFEPRLRTGVFVDSPVEGLSYVTDTRSGITDSDGRFVYLPGESVTFSIGELVFPTVKARERLTPIDLGRGSQDVERYATNMARLLQSLDADDDASNGIAITSAVRDRAMDLDLDVESRQFETNPGVVELVTGAGGRGELISAALAMEHLGIALGVASARDETTDLAGFWKNEEGDWSSFIAYARISSDAEISLYHYAYTPDGLISLDCYLVEHRSLAPLGGDDYLSAVAPVGGNLAHLTLSRASADSLTISLGKSDSANQRTVATTRVSDRTPADLNLCTGESLQVPSVQLMRPVASLAGLWSFDDAEWHDAGGRTIRYLRMNRSGDGELLVQERQFGSAPLYELGECHIEWGDLKMYPTDEDHVFEGNAILPTRVIDGSGDDQFEYLDHWNRNIRLETAGEALLLSLEGEAVRRLSPVTVDTAGLTICGNENITPLTAVQGLWREQGDGLFGDYVHIGPDGVLGGIIPSLDGNGCYLDVPSASLTPIGGLDFVSVRDDNGSTRTLRMHVGGSNLTISELGPDGSATPIRWLEKAHGLFIADFLRCESQASNGASAELEPLVGQWSRIVDESVNPWGPDGSPLTYRLYEVIEITASGRYFRKYASIGEFHSFSRDTLCNATDEISPSYGDGMNSHFEVIGDGLFRIQGDLATLVREGDTLTRIDAGEVAKVYEPAVFDMDALPDCHSGHSEVDSALGPLDGVWLLEAPVEDDASFTVLRLDTRHRESDEHFLFRFDAEQACHVVDALWFETAGDDRIVLDRRQGDGSAVGAFRLVDDELDIELRSGAGSLPGVADGRYSRVLGLIPDRLSADYNPDRYLDVCRDYEP